MTSSPATAAFSLKQGHRRQFIRQFIGEPKVIGALAPSSSHLARRMVADLPWSKARVVVEYGPGTGVVTEQILLSMPRDCIFFGIERNERMVELSRRRHPGVSIYQDNAAKVSDLCVQQGLAAEGSVDLVLSGLPWPSFTDELRADILNATAQVLRPGGVFVTFGYHIGLVLRGAWHFRRTVSELFSDVSTSKVVWRNVPPAFVYRCTK